MTNLSGGKVRPQCFEILRTYYWYTIWRKGSVIMGTYYVSLLRRLCDVIKENQVESYILRVGWVLFHQDNAAVYTSVGTMAALHQCDFKTVQQPPYSTPRIPIYSKNWKRNLTVLIIPRMMTSWLILKSFLTGKIRAYISKGSGYCSIAGESVSTSKGPMFLN